MISLVVVLLVVGLIALTFYLAKKSALVCPDCGSKESIRTGESRDLKRNQRAFIAMPVPECELEYKCKDCGKNYWSVIEKVFG